MCTVSLAFWALGCHGPREHGETAQCRQVRFRNFRSLFPAGPRSEGIRREGPPASRRTISERNCLLDTGTGPDCTGIGSVASFCQSLRGAFHHRARDEMGAELAARKGGSACEREGEGGRAAEGMQNQGPAGASSSPGSTDALEKGPRHSTTTAFRSSTAQFWGSREALRRRSGNSNRRPAGAETAPSIKNERAKGEGRALKLRRGKPRL